MNEQLITLRNQMRHCASTRSEVEYAQGYAQCAKDVADALDSVPSRCEWFGEGRGQCLLKVEHKGAHTCEEDGRLLMKAFDDSVRYHLALKQISDDEFVTLSSNEDPSYEACYWRVVKIASSVVRFQK